MANWEKKADEADAPSTTNGVIFSNISRPYPVFAFLHKLLIKNVFFWGGSPGLLAMGD